VETSEGIPDHASRPRSGARSALQTCSEAAHSRGVPVVRLTVTSRTQPAHPRRFAADARAWNCPRGRAWYLTPPGGEYLSRWSGVQQLPGRPGLTVEGTG
jgi:hypothetical protein